MRDRLLMGGLVGGARGWCLAWQPHLRENESDCPRRSCGGNTELVPVDALVGSLPDRQR